MKLKPKKNTIFSLPLSQTATVFANVSSRKKKNVQPAVMGTDMAAQPFLLVQ